MTPSKNYRDTCDDVDEEFRIVILPQNDNIMPRVDPLDLGKKSRDDYFRPDFWVSLIGHQQLNFDVIYASQLWLLMFNYCCFMHDASSHMWSWVSIRIGCVLGNQIWHFVCTKVHYFSELGLNGVWDWFMELSNKGV
ncbi:hypothetical protein L6452_32425 [Arctium lappa]|uniref:Uncharacterized protein n=1 Tax=Arctium lappa TaxID=4217 RepID=A0ACB8Z8U1_ARCLA|nr:hypothetical protein L6452_32425 [Arctium lappa]